MDDLTQATVGIDWSQVPPPSERRIALRVAPAAELALRQGHPWLFDGAIRQQSYEGQAGDLAVVFDRYRRFLALGLYDPTSPIRVHVLVHKEPATIDLRWFRERIRESADVRKPLLDTATNGYRVVHGENDGLPGLVIDRYDRTFVVKCYTPAWIRHLPMIIKAIVQSLPAHRIVLRLGRTARRQPELLFGLTDGQVVYGAELEGPIVFQENGLRFEADPQKGQKTGFYLDQRDNRARVERLARGKSVLNVFAYTGGFTVYAARGGAQSVASVDASRLALEAGQRNVALNQDLPAVSRASYEWLLQDAFDCLERLQRARKQFDVVILDPPAFAAQQDQVRQALTSYGRLTTLALGVLGAGGTLVQASCSSRVSEEDFYAVVHRAAKAAGRPLQELERTGHGLDHPITFPEGAYLKCLFARARDPLPASGRGPARDTGGKSQPPAPKSSRQPEGRDRSRKREREQR